MNDLSRLQQRLRHLGPVAVAVSGGVDSMTLAVVSHRVNPASVMFHAISPAVPRQATRRVEQYACREGWRLEIIDAGEMVDPDYIANPANRCYFCKTHLYDTVVRHTRLPVVSGTNTDDLGDYRPGLIAAEEHAVYHPYVDVGIDKPRVRNIARSLGLSDLEELPAAPCLSSRVTTGIAIDPDMLPVIDEVEQRLWEYLPARLPVSGIRCRVRPGAIAIEVASNDLVDDLAEWAPEARHIAARLLEENGYGDFTDTVTVEPYKRGSAFLIETRQVE